MLSPASAIVRIALVTAAEPDASQVTAPVQAVYGSEVEVRFTVTNSGVNTTDKTVTIS